MGTIIERKRSNGSVGYSAQIIIKQKGVIVHRETQTFDRRPPAVEWIKRRESELKRPGGIEAAKAGSPTVRRAIERYVDESVKEIGRTKAQVLETIKSDPIADMLCEKVTSAHVVEFARRRLAVSQPQTVGNYVSHLAAVFEMAKPAWGYPLDRVAMKDAQTVLKNQGAVSKSKSRDRIPSMDELDRLLTFFEGRSARNKRFAPMHKIIVFALFSTRRQEEIIRIEWRDLDPEHSRVLVRDMKHPGDKIGNDQWVDLPEPAMRVVQSMPKNEKEPRIFPFSTDAISAAFTRACHLLGIDGLRFHDLRHAGTTRLFEMGHTIPQAASVTGHRSWNSLKRYSHVRSKGDRYENWEWIERVCR